MTITLKSLVSEHGQPSVKKYKSGYAQFVGEYIISKQFANKQRALSDLSDALRYGHFESDDFFIEI